MMSASPELYYEIEYRQHERALERAAEYRRMAELSPGQVVPYVSVFSRIVTRLRGVAQRRRTARLGRGAGEATRADTPSKTGVDALA